MMNIKKHFSDIWAFFFIILAYFVAGKLALLLAIPPGYATAIWPAAGIALAATLLLGNSIWPAIAIGSFLVNFSFNMDVSSTIIALFIGLGAAMQAVIGRLLLYKYLEFPNPLYELKVILIFFLFSGPISCLCNSTFGVLCLYLSGTIELANVFFSWWTWWVGDTLGIFTVVPIILIWVTDKNKVNSRRVSTVIFPLITMFICIVILFFLASHREQEHIKQKFQQNMHNVFGTLKKNFDRYPEILYSIASFYNSSTEVTKKEFDEYTKYFLQNNPGIQALEWIPKVYDSERKNYEDSARNAGHIDFCITELDKNGQMVPVARRDYYFPVYFLEPYKGNEKALGFDLASNSKRLKTLNKAIDTAQVTASDRVVLVQDDSNNCAVLLLLAIYQKDKPLESFDDRKRALKGFILGVFRMDNMVKSSLSLEDFHHITFRIDDLSAVTLERELFTYSSESYDEKQVSTDFQYQEMYQLGNRKWLFSVTPLVKYFNENRSMVAWMVLAGGILFFGVLEILLLVVTGRTALTEKLVIERTSELRKATKEAQMASEAKSEFLSNMSHELRTPLNAIIGYTECLIDEIDGPVNKTQKNSMQTVLKAADNLLELINTVLDLSKIESGKMELYFESFDIKKLASECLDMVSAVAQKKELTLKKNFTNDTVVVFADIVKIRQIILNLLSNAIKFTQKGLISLDISKVERKLEVKISDQGIGMSQEELEIIFTKFTQANTSTTRTYGGSGLGLAISKKYAEMHGGGIRVQSTKGKGSIFILTLQLSQ